ncbi:MAG TPA: hypothetical protein VM052_03485 [Candidatus Limnocylindrales bacterium]|nr:hypothetical protein [Candidatus Limnocylindrales bacterium]
MASRIADFNYKVALASGLKSLQGGRLRQAEEQFRYLTSHFPAAEGGYRGLAKVLLEQEDRAGALRTLLDGGAALAKAQQRTQAISLYREAIVLAPSDLGAHRRLVAALINAGETEEAANEFVRFIRDALGARDNDRAMRESEYALERIPGHAGIESAARNAGALPQLPRYDAPIPSAPPSADERESLIRSVLGTPPAPTQRSNESADPPAWSAPQPMTPARDAAAAGWPAADASPTPWPAPGNGTSAWDSPPSASPAAAPSAAPDNAPKRVVDPWATPEEVALREAESRPISAETEPQKVEEIAALFLARGDPRGGEHALEAARRYIAEGHFDAASDLLLDLVASGIATHDAQRLLLDVARGLGKTEVAKAKLELLVQMLKLDGRTDLAAEVEQLAQGS